MIGKLVKTDKCDTIWCVNTEIGCIPLHESVINLIKDYPEETKFMIDCDMEFNIIVGEGSVMVIYAELKNIEQIKRDITIGKII